MARRPQTPPFAIDEITRVIERMVDVLQRQQVVSTPNNQSSVNNLLRHNQNQVQWVSYFR